MKKDHLLECSCGADISDNGYGALYLYLKVILHLASDPHQMGRARHMKSSDKSESFFDAYNPGHKVSLFRRILQGKKIRKEN